MINFIYLFFASYILTLSGYLLGKSTLEEHKEIKNKVLFSSEILLVVFTTIFAYLFFKTHLVLTGLIIFFTIQFIITKKILKNEDLVEFNFIIILAISLIGFFKYNIEKIYIILIIIISMILDKSLKEFNLKKEIYIIIIYAIIYFIYFLISNFN